MIPRHIGYSSLRSYKLAFSSGQIRGQQRRHLKTQEDIVKAYKVAGENAIKAAKEKESKQSAFQRITYFVSQNRQAIVNMIGAYFLLSYAIYNYKVKLAWNDLTKEMDDLQKEYDNLKTSIQDEMFLKKLEYVVKNGGKTAELKLEMSKVVEETMALYSKQTQEQTDAIANQIKVKEMEGVAASNVDKNATIGTSLLNLGSSKASPGRII